MQRFEEYTPNHMLVSEYKCVVVSPTSASHGGDAL
jgi:hypothetical protein